MFSTLSKRLIKSSSYRFSTPVPRFVCNVPCKLDPQTQTQMFHFYDLVSLSDPSLNAQEAITKGFAYLSIDRKQYWFCALDCFHKASKLDVHKQFSHIIDCGMKQARDH